MCLNLCVKVSVAEDATRIWLVDTYAGDKEFVQYLRQHPVLTRTDQQVGFAS